MWPFNKPKQKEDYKIDPDCTDLNQHVYAPSASYAYISTGWATSSLISYPVDNDWYDEVWLPPKEKETRYVICQSCFATTVTPRCEYCGRPVD